MELKKIALWLVVSVALVSTWVVWWIQPERQVRRAQGRLISAVEKRDFEAMDGLLASDYQDRWQHTKASVVSQTRQVFSQFLMLTIVREDRGVQLDTDSFVVREKFTIEGMGGALAMAVKDEVNRLREPFAMTWRRRGWKPWDWEILSVEQRELRLPE